jgi:hypothetical protein
MRDRSWARLASLFAVAVLLRVAFAAYVNTHATAGPEIPDADGYIGAALMLAKGGPRALFDALTYAYDGFMKAPLYQVFLALFAGAPDFPRLIPYLHAVLSATTVVSAFALADALHSRRAAWLSAIAAAVWFSSVISPPGIWQEQLYAPLLAAAMAVLAAALTDDGAALFAVAGAMLGMAALTRSMPVFFVLAAAALWKWVDDSPARWRRLFVWLAAFAIVVGPYCVAASLHARQLVLVENIAFSRVDRFDPPGHPISAGFAPARSLGAGFAIRARQFAADPVWVTRRFIWPVRELLTPTALPWLRFYDVAAGKEQAMETTWLVRVWSVAGEAGVLLLAPLGAVFARRRATVVLFGAWCLLHVLAVATTGDAGPRYRFPLEPFLIVLASVAIAGSWRSASAMLLCTAGAAALVIAIGLAHFIPETAAVRPDYGVEKWSRNLGDRLTVAHGAAGMNVAASGRRVRLHVRCRTGSACGPMRVTVDRRPLTSIGESEMRAGAWVEIAKADDRAFTYVEIEPAAGAVLEIDVTDPPYEPIVVAAASGQPQTPGFVVTCPA